MKSSIKGLNTKINAQLSLLDSKLYTVESTPILSEPASLINRSRNGGSIRSPSMSFKMIPLPPPLINEEQHSIHNGQIQLITPSTMFRQNNSVAIPRHPAFTIIRSQSVTNARLMSQSLVISQPNQSVMRPLPIAFLAKNCFLRPRIQNVQVLENHQVQYDGRYFMQRSRLRKRHDNNSLNQIRLPGSFTSSNRLSFTYNNQANHQFFQTMQQFMPNNTMQQLMPNKTTSSQIFSENSIIKKQPKEADDVQIKQKTILKIIQENVGIDHFNVLRRKQVSQSYGIPKSEGILKRNGIFKTNNQIEMQKLQELHLQQQNQKDQQLYEQEGEKDEEEQEQDQDEQETEKLDQQNFFQGQQTPSPIKPLQFFNEDGQKNGDDQVVFQQRQFKELQLKLQGRIKKYSVQKSDQQSTPSLTQPKETKIVYADLRSKKQTQSFKSPNKMSQSLSTFQKKKLQQKKQKVAQIVKA